MEEKKARTLQDIQQEYTQLAAKLGHAHTQIKTLNKEITRVEEGINDLILEQAKLVSEQVPTSTPDGLPA